MSERAEVVGQDPDHRQTYDLAVARAVARMPILMEYLLPLIHRNGKVMAMKGETAPVETHSASRAIHLLGENCINWFTSSCQGSWRSALL